MKIPIQKIIEMRNMGLSVLDIANKIECSHQNISKRLRIHDKRIACFKFPVEVKSASYEIANTLSTILFSCLRVRDGISKKFTGRDFIREKARIRDDHTCQECFRRRHEGERRFDLHHINGLCGKKSRGYDRKCDIGQLITLCHKCHFNRHDFSQNKKTTI
jgi:hypothetical protein